MGNHKDFDICDTVQPVIGDRQRVAGRELHVPFCNVVVGLFALSDLLRPVFRMRPGGMRIASWVKSREYVTESLALTALE